MGQRPRGPICLPGPKEVGEKREDGWYCYFYTYNETEEESVSESGMGWFWLNTLRIIFGNMETV